jgi:ribosome-associated protein
MPPCARRWPDVRVPDAELEWRFTGPGGPGGQHANTSNTRVEVTFDIAGSPSLDEPLRQRLMAALGPRVRVVCSASRSQRRNRVEARRLLEQRLADALRRPPTRRPSRPGRGAVERRLTDKRRRSETKARRRWQSGD